MTVRREPYNPLPHFVGLGDLPGGRYHSFAASMSADGQVVVGASDSASGREAFCWTSSGGMKGLGFTEAVSVSGSGSVVVGYRTRLGRIEPVRWTGDGDVESLSMDEPDASGTANAVSADGVVIVGSKDVDRPPVGDRDQAIHWTRSSSPSFFGIPNEGNASSEANAVTADGATAVGWSRNRNGHKEACLWETGAAPVLLGSLSGHATSIAYGISADGSTVVGCSSDYITTEAFRWTRDAGMISLGLLPEGSGESAAYGVSGDGSTIVGYCRGASGWEAFVWRTEQGMQSARQLIAGQCRSGVMLRGWRLHCATCVSADGGVVAGFGLNPAGRQEAWVARFKSCPPAPTHVATTALTRLPRPQFSRQVHWPKR
jgi:probable HAF family extracellular repeat protein